VSIDIFPLKLVPEMCYFNFVQVSICDMRRGIKPNLLPYSSSLSLSTERDPPPPTLPNSRRNRAKRSTKASNLSQISGSGTQTFLIRFECVFCLFDMGIRREEVVSHPFSEDFSSDGSSSPEREFDISSRDSDSISLSTMCSSDPGNCVVHEVSKLDTLAGLAIKYGVEVIFNFRK
jgi:hypothetical protein